jgi:hypothetical protein
LEVVQNAPTATKTKPRSPEKKTPVGPYSLAIQRGARGWAVDGRSREGKFLRTYEHMLTVHVGGEPSRVQTELIRRAARVALRLELMDEESLLKPGISERQSRYYLAWHNTLVRTLREIGVVAAGDRAGTLEDLMARTAAERAQQGADKPGRGNGTDTAPPPAWCSPEPVDDGDWDDAS